MMFLVKRSRLTIEGIEIVVFMAQARLKIAPQSPIYLAPCACDTNVSRAPFMPINRLKKRTSSMRFAVVMPMTFCGSPSRVA